MDAIRVVVRRGAVVEAVHRVHAATTWGDTWGSPSLAFLLRSSVKPLQAIPFVEGYEDLDDDEIAISCASHHAEPAQLAAVARCSPARGPPSTISRTERRRAARRGASGTTARASTLGCWRHAAPTTGRSTRTATPRTAPAADRGGRRRAGRGGRRMRAPDVRDDARRCRCAPDANAGADPIGDARASRACRGRAWCARHGSDAQVDGWIAKGGAEGLYCAAHEDGRGFALKVGRRLVPRAPARARRGARARHLP